VHNVRVVNGRFSSRYVVRGFGFCDLNSPDISRRVRATLFVRINVIGLVVQLNMEVIRRLVGGGGGTNLIQRFVERILVLPLNVVTSPLISNLHRVQCEVWDDWKKRATADDRNDHDYAECNKPESSRYCLHSERCFDSARGNYQA